MTNQNSQIKETISAANGSNLLEKAEAGIDIVLRDDQEEFITIRDAARICRKKGKSFRMIDTGISDRAHLEWIIEAGADLYTSDKVGREFQELDFLCRTARKAKRHVALFLENVPQEEKSENTYLPSELFLLGENGITIHVSNKKNKFPIDLLEELAFRCRQGGSWLVYYHHGSLDPCLISIGEKGSWIHISENDLDKDENALLIHDIIQAARSNGSNLILHLEKDLPYVLLKEILETGAVILFKIPPIDYRSPLRKLENMAKRQHLDPRVYYLYTAVMP